jgi:hypothetical protein
MYYDARSYKRQKYGNLFTDTVNCYMFRPFLWSPSGRYNTVDGYTENIELMNRIKQKIHRYKMTIIETGSSGNLKLYLVASRNVLVLFGWYKQKWRFVIYHAICITTRRVTKWRGAALHDTTRHDTPSELLTEICCKYHPIKYQKHPY